MTPAQAVVVVLALLIAVGAGIGIGFALDEGSQSTVTEAADFLEAADETAAEDTPPSTTMEGSRAGSGELTEDEQALRRRVRESPSVCEPLEPIFGEMALIGCRSANGVVTQYSQFANRVALDRAYDSILEELGVERGTGIERCPVGIPSEQAWTRGDTPMGRLACFSRNGVAWMAWTHEPLNILAVYTAPEGMGSVPLYDWWAGGGRLDFFDDELAFYVRVPESHRASCAFTFVTGNTPVAGPPPAQGSTARCYVPSPKSPDDPLRRITVSYVQHPTFETMSSYYAQVTNAAGIAAANSGLCPNDPPGEGQWNRNGHNLGRIGCAQGASGPFMAWTTVPLLIMATATAPPQLTLVELYEWWSQQSGPTYQPGG